MSRATRFLPGGAGLAVYRGWMLTVVIRSMSPDTI